MTTDPERELAESRSSERLSHGLYGLIIITATLVADRELADDAMEALASLWLAVFVLLLAHLYSSLIGIRAAKHRGLTGAERILLIEDNLPLLGAIVVPTLLLLAAEAGWISLRAAIDASIVFAIGTLFVVGVVETRAIANSSLMRQLATGLLGAAMGCLIILAEALLTH